MNRFNLVLGVAVCLLCVTGVYGQVQKPNRVRAGDGGPAPAHAVEPDSPSTSSSLAAGPQANVAGSEAIVPRLMKFSGVLQDTAGKPLTGTVDVTFSLYNTEAGGNPLWYETQSVQADELGRYTALLGAMHANGLPIDLFTSGEVRWLGIQVGTEAEQQPRVLLVSVPYALKAGDAETLGGKPASAYMLSGAPTGTALITASSTPTRMTAPASVGGKDKKSSTADNSPATPCTSVTSDGTVAVNTIPLFSTACNIQGSNIHQYNGNVGVGILYPSVGFYVSNPAKHDGDARFDMVLEDTTPATAGTGGGMDFTGYITGTTTKAGLASIRGVKENSIQGNSSSAMIFDTRANGGNQTERMRISSAGNVGIGTTAPGDFMDVSIGNSGPPDHGITIEGSTSVVGDLGLKIHNTGAGGVGWYLDSTNSASGYGGGKLAFVPNPGTFPPAMVITASDQVGIGTASPAHTLDVAGDINASGNITTGATFTAANEEVTGDLNLPATTSSAVGVINVGGSPFIHACCGNNANTFVGKYAGNFTTTGGNNTAAGYGALYSNTTGGNNTAAGYGALYYNTTGIGNTADGIAALQSNTTGVLNTASGYSSLYSNTTGNYNTAGGYLALTANTTGSGNTANGASALYSNTTGTSNTAFGASALYYTDSAASGGANTGVGTEAGKTNTTGTYNTFLGYLADASAGTLINATAIGANAVVGVSNALVLGSINGVNGATSNVNVGIGTSAPGDSLQVDGGDVIIGPVSNLPYKGVNALYLANDGGDVDNTFRLDAYNDDIALKANSSGLKDATITFWTGAGGNGEHDRMRISGNGNVGIGTDAPTELLSVNGGANKAGGGSWDTFSDARLKTIDRSFNLGLAQVLKLKPIVYRYKQHNAMDIKDHDPHVGLVAQEVQKVIPEAVSANAKGYLMINNDPIIWAMLNAIKEQHTELRQARAQNHAKQVEIQKLAGQVRELRQEQTEIAALKARLDRLEAGDSASRLAQVPPARSGMQPGNAQVARARF